MSLRTASLFAVLAKQCLGDELKEHVTGESCSMYMGEMRNEYSMFCTCERKSYLEDLDVNGPPLWSSGQSSWLQIRRPGFDSRHYQK
jgi:hypothetical protein